LSNCSSIPGADYCACGVQMTCATIHVSFPDVIPLHNADTEELRLTRELYKQVFD
jgi:hypothetical protein